MAHTNVLLVFADQMRGQAMGCAGNAQARTPHLDRLAAEGTRFAHAYCHSPVCTPSRGSLLTGLYPAQHGALVNDVPIRTDVRSMGRIFRDAGYAAGYVGKWHLDSEPRDKFTPPGPRRLGFDDCWAVHNCTHAYLDTFYYADSPEPIFIDGYEPEHQTELAREFLRGRAGGPWCLVVSYGTPHDPYQAVPERWKAMYDPGAVALRPNVPPASAEAARRDLAGYYAHVTALDEFVGRLMATLEETGQADRTLVVFTSDHGDMHGSQGEIRKQKPWEESIGVPLVARLPGTIPAGRTTDALVGVVDMLPTILGLAGLGGAEAMQGCDLSAAATGDGAGREDVLLMNPVSIDDGKDQPGWWGLRTPRCTYARTLDGPWLLYDNEADPYQMRNLADDAASADLLHDLDRRLRRRLDEIGEPMLPWPETIRSSGLVRQWNARERHLHGEGARLLSD